MSYHLKKKDIQSEKIVKVQEGGEGQNQKNHHQVNLLRNTIWAFPTSSSLTLYNLSLINQKYPRKHVIGYPFQNQMTYRTTWNRNKVRKRNQLAITRNQKNNYLKRMNKVHKTNIKDLLRKANKFILSIWRIPLEEVQ